MGGYVKKIFRIKGNRKTQKSWRLKEIEKNLFELEKNLFKTDKKYYDYDGTEYKGIRDARNLFDMSIVKDYYRPIRINNAFNGYDIEWESIGDKDKTLIIKEHLNIIRPYISDVINDQKTQDKWKIQLTMTINFLSLKDSEETCTMNKKSDNTEIMMGNETDEIIEELFEPLLERYEEWLEESMRGSEFVFDSVNLLYYKLHKISLRGGSYIVSPKWLKIKKATINP